MRTHEVVADDVGLAARAAASSHASWNQVTAARSAGVTAPLGIGIAEQLAEHLLARADRTARALARDAAAAQRLIGAASAGRTSRRARCRSCDAATCDALVEHERLVARGGDVGGSSGVSSRSVDSAMAGCYCAVGGPSRIVTGQCIDPSAGRAFSTACPGSRAPSRCRCIAARVSCGRAAWLHATAAPEVELVDIELAPPPPKAEALPEEVASADRSRRRRRSRARAAHAADEPRADGAGRGATRRSMPGVDAPVDATRTTKKRPDAAVDARAMQSRCAMRRRRGVRRSGRRCERSAIAGSARSAIGRERRSGPDDAGIDRRDRDRSRQRRSGSGSLGSGADGSGCRRRRHDGSGSGVAGDRDRSARRRRRADDRGHRGQPARVLPAGHIAHARSSASIACAAPSGRSRPRRCSGRCPTIACCSARATPTSPTKLDTLVDLDAAAARRDRDDARRADAAVARAELRDFLGAGAPITWSATSGGMLGKRTQGVPRTTSASCSRRGRAGSCSRSPPDLGDADRARVGQPRRVEATGQAARLARRDPHDRDQESGDDDSDGPGARR